MGRKAKEGVLGFENKLLKVIEFSHFANRMSHWKIQCKCDNSIHTISWKRLRESNFKLNICPDMDKKNNSAFNSLYLTYKQKAKERNLDFKLNKNEFKILTSNVCKYCNLEPKQIYKQTAGTGGIYTYNGIDRVNNNIGYILENCVSCCMVCNHSKHTMSKDDFYNWIEKVYKNMKKEARAEINAETKEWQ